MTNGPESRPSHDTDDGGTAGQGSGEHACERVTSCQNETPPGRPPPQPSGQGEWRARRPRPAVLRSGPRALGPALWAPPLTGAGTPIAAARRDGDVRPSLAA